MEIQALTVKAFEPYGWLLGKAMRPNSGLPAFHSPASDFWEEHLFDAGEGGQTEVLWVVYRNSQQSISNLEVHRLTQQAVVPLTAGIIQIVAASNTDGSPDLESLRAFKVPVSQGICMRPGCWHTTRVAGQEATCLMLTRRSTTIDLAAYLTSGSHLSESAIAVVPATLVIAL